MGKTRKKAWMKTAHLFTGENNQFRMKFNRTKHEVLNAKVKGTKGNPLVSRGIMYSKLKKQWEKNQVASKKSNRFIDKRQLHPSISSEDRATARLIREHKKKAKKNKFNLNDDVELTHKGRPIGDIKDWNNADSGSEEEQTLDADFVSRAHFGGFASESNFETPKSHKEIVEELISESKKKKQEKKSEKDRYNSTQEMLDQEWKEIQSSINFTSGAGNIAQTDVREEKDDYDIIKNELKFERKISSISHTKTPEEIARDEEEKVIKRRKERLARIAEDSAIKLPDGHISADALCDDFDVEFYAEQKQIPDEESDVDMEDEEEDLETIDQGSSVYNFPKDLKSFKLLVKDCDADQLYDTIHSMIKDAVRSKSQRVKTELVSLFSILLQYALYSCKSNSSDSEKASVIVTHLHALADAEPQKTSKIFLDFMDKEQEMLQECKKRVNEFRSSYPRLPLIKILRFTGLIYSVSDRVHPVGLPAMDLMSDILSSPFVNTHSNIVSRLVVSSIWLSFIRESKRLVPEAINYLDTVLKLAIPANLKHNCTKGKKRYSLVLDQKSSSEDFIPLDMYQKKKFSSDEEKVSIIFEAICQLNVFTDLYSDLLSFKTFFAPTVALCLQLPVEDYPAKLQEVIKKFITFVQDQKTVLKYLKFPEVRPKCPKLFAPAVKSKFSRSEAEDINKKRKQLKEVQQKIKKEERGVLREIRRTAEVDAAQRLKERLESDAERKRKVKEIYTQLSMQEGEYKKMMKKKS